MNHLQPFNFPPIPYFGSFQKNRFLFRTEEPLNEVWSQISRFGTSFLKKYFNSSKSDFIPKDFFEYTEIRMRQAVEFRNAAHNATPLTSPLLLYYSFLNLTRAFLSLDPEENKSKRHGLNFRKGKDILSSYATLSDGTFTDYLTSQKISWNKGDAISLSHALGSIIEFEYDYKLFNKNNSHIQKVFVDAVVNEQVKLIFPNYPHNFENDWCIDFPELASYCEIDNENTLLIKESAHINDYEAIENFLENHLLPPLNIQNEATWFAIRKKELPLALTRSAYYYISIFILGSIVRYEPEIIYSISQEDSEAFWILERFLKIAERYFPQLKIMELYKSQIYFSGYTSF